MSQPDLTLTLYVDRQFLSPWAMTAFVALVEKKVPFTLATIDLDAGEARAAPFRDLSLTARVPALRHGDFVLSESSAIADYLDDVFGAPAPSVLPRDVRQRARARQIQSWIRSDLLALRNERDTRVVFRAMPGAPLSPAAQAAAASLLRVAGTLLQGEHLCGAWSIADSDLALMLNRLILCGDPVPQALRDYAAAQWARPSVRAWLEHAGRAA